MEVMKDSGDYIEHSDYLKLLESTIDEMEKVTLILLWKTGRRIEELLGGTLKRSNKLGKSTILCPGLRVADIDFDNKVIHFWIIKKKQIRKAPKPVDDELLSILKDYITKSELGPDDRIIPRTRQWFDLALKRMSDKTGVLTFSKRRLHAHCFRHSWNRQAGMSAQTPEDISIQSAYMEHSSQAVTMNYYMKFGAEAQRKLIDRMAKKNE